MFPYFTLFGKTVGMYAVMAFVGIAAASLMLFLLSRKTGIKISLDDTVLFVLFVIGGVGIGGTLLYAITNFKYFALFAKVESIKDFFAVFKFLFGGSVFYGGLIGACVFALIGIKVLKLELKLYADLMAVSVPLFHGFARIGCFLGGCCYGIESDFGFIAHGNPLVPELNDVRRFPVQLLESLCNFIIFAILFTLFIKFRDKGRLKGRMILIYFTLYSVTRFCVEFLRGDAVRGFVWGLSTSQFISVLLFIASVIGFIVSERIIIKKECVSHEQQIV